MIAADGDANGQVDNLDKDEVWLIQKNSTGYKSGDFNMDGQVNDTDRNDFWTPNSGKGEPGCRSKVIIIKIN